MESNIRLTFILLVIATIGFAVIGTIIGEKIGKQKAYSDVEMRCLNDNQSLVYADAVKKCNYVVWGK